MKDAQRRRAYDARSAQSDKMDCSRRAIAQLRSMPTYRAAKTILWYVHARSELRTQWVLPSAIQEKERIAVPYCTQDKDGTPQLGLVQLQHVNELSPGMWQILEPCRQLREEATRIVHPATLDFVVVPGVSFSRDGTRLGNGQGYYDRLLSRVRADCTLCGLCFECQIFDDLRGDVHDVAMHYVATESNLYAGRRSRSDDD